jgi:hypothetical protein
VRWETIDRRKGIVTISRVMSAMRGIGIMNA